MLCRICIAQIQPRKHVLLINHADYTAPTRHELDRTHRSGIYPSSLKGLGHTDHTDHTDHQLEINDLFDECIVSSRILNLPASRYPVFSRSGYHSSFGPNQLDLEHYARRGAPGIFTNTRNFLKNQEISDAPGIF